MTTAPNPVDIRFRLSVPQRILPDMNTARDPAPDAHCPTCGLDGEGYLVRGAAVTRADYQCPAGHLWTTRWPTEQA